MTDQELEAIVGGYHGDPFRILGPHPSNGDSKPENWKIRAFLPQADSASVVEAGREIPMQKVHPQGFFSATIAKRPESYKLKVTNHSANAVEIEDPYRFPPLLSDFDLHLHAEGTHLEAYNMLGAHPITVDGVEGTRFAVWAPNAIVVSVVGDFNHWDSKRHPMRARTSGIWELFLPGIGPGSTYKYAILSRYAGYCQMKADPYGFSTEVPPKSASVVADLDRYQWQDNEWIEKRANDHLLDRPMSIYEIHLASWMRGPHQSFLTYRELADRLVEYVRKMGYTHIELLPMMEHPYTGSWGYQVVGYFAPTSRFGSSEDFMYFVDRCHQAGIGVIIDWVPAHFPKDAHGLAFFDGTALYEHEDPRKGEHREWGTLIFNYGRNEVRTFLMSNALFWLKKYHIDGLRVDAVASMIYLDYSRKPGEWIPNIHGGNENLEAIDFLRKMNEVTHEIPGVVTIAEESTAFPGVSRPVYMNGLGFTMKWNMGWMHDILHYFSEDSVHRKYHHHNITFSMIYAFTENFVLPISHDEVVYGKRSLISKMPGDEWQRFANARAFLGYMYGHPGKKLLFMGSEIGQTSEWNHDGSVEWDLLQFPIHRTFQEYCRVLNELYKSEPALYEVDFRHEGFEWIDFHDVESSIISFLRRAQRSDDFLVFACNFTPVPRRNYRIGVPEHGLYREVLNSDSELFGGSNLGNGGAVMAEAVPSHGRPASVMLTLPPLGVIVLKPARPLREPKKISPNGDYFG